jgi:twitching motility two-component system response regulator PilH
MAKVLIVDDSATYRLRLRQLVQRLGHEAVLAHDGLEGIERARSDRPDVILMDILMPGMNGFEAKRSLARDEATASIPVVFVTTESDAVDRDWGMRQGGAGYVTKPVDLQALQSAISAAISS